MYRSVRSILNKFIGADKRATGFDEAGKRDIVPIRFVESEITRVATHSARGNEKKRMHNGCVSQRQKCGKN